MDCADAEPDRHIRILNHLVVPCHFLVLVVSHVPAHRQQHATECGTKVLLRCSSCKHQIATGTLHQRAYRRSVSLVFDEVALPVLRHHPVFNLS